MLVNIYEAVNKTLKEVYLGGSDVAVKQLQDMHKKFPPAAIAHWDFEHHKIDYAEIERGLPRRDIGLFIESYDLSTPMPGWKIFKESP